jgi:serine O-acetyltransferase
MRAMRIRGSSAAEEEYHPYLALRSIGDRRRGSVADRAPPRPDEPAVRAARLGRASLWSEIESQAVEMAAREPMLRQKIDETGFDATPARIVSAVLSCRLASGHRSAIPLLQTLVLDALGEDPTVLEFLEIDLRTVVAHDPACRSGLHALLHLKGFHALQTHRVAHSLWKRGREDIAHWLASQASATLGVDIHPAVPIGAGVMLDHGTGIVIGETAVVEEGVTILQGVTLGATGKHGGDRHPKVRHGALLGAGAMVLGNIEIGRMSRVGAGSVVLRSVPAYSTVTGVAARVVRRRDADGIEITVQGRPE